MPTCSMHQKGRWHHRRIGGNASALSGPVLAPTQGQAPIRSSISGTDFLPNSTVSWPSLRITMQGTLMT